jgi:hypothetical protein
MLRLVTFYGLGVLYLSYPHVGCVACIAKFRAGFGKLDPVFCFIFEPAGECSKISGVKPNIRLISTPEETVRETLSLSR